MKTIKLVVEYDGTDFVGWQYQENGRSVQEELEQVLSRLMQQRVPVVGAGRTDAGVHARGQVASFRVEHYLTGEPLRRGLNALLPEDILVRAVEERDESFHARYSARERRYTYHILLEPSLFLRRYAWDLGYKLDFDVLRRSAEYLAGEHDFSSFCKTGSDVNHYRCIIRDAHWTFEPPHLTFHIAADRFLRGMVRLLVGTQIEAARGYRPPDDIVRILEAHDNREAGMSAPARGLFLDEVLY